jgi:hypothetical protein
MYACEFLPYALSELTGMVTLLKVQLPSLVESVYGDTLCLVNTAQSSVVRRPNLFRQPILSAGVAVLRSLLFRTAICPEPTKALVDCKTRALVSVTETAKSAERRVNRAMIDASLRFESMPFN